MMLMIIMIMIIIMIRMRLIRMIVIRVARDVLAWTVIVITTIKTVIVMDGNSNYNNKILITL
jgi:hypothetical protein